MRQSGGYSRGVPPLPIPNREVKPARADGTAPQCGRVGRRRLQGVPRVRKLAEGLLFLCPRNAGGWGEWVNGVDGLNGLNGADGVDGENEENEGRETL